MRRLMRWTGRGAAQLALLRANPELMDADWYLQTNPDVREYRGGAVEHYHRFGWKEGRNPSPFFDVRWYLANNPDVAAAEIDPLLHYLQVGRQEGRQTTPGASRSAMQSELSATAAADPSVFTALENLDYDSRASLADRHRQIAALVSRSGLFTEEWYRFRNPDIEDRDALKHYVEYGIWENRAPNPYFDALWYAKRNALPAGVPSLLHYLGSGWRAGVDPGPNFSIKRYMELSGWTPASGREPLKGFLDGGYKAISKLPPVLANRPHHLISISSSDSELLSGSSLRFTLDFPAAKDRPSGGSFPPDCLAIHWVIPDFGVGGGGHMTIFRMVRELALKGHKQKIWLHGAKTRDPEAVFELIAKHYQCFDAEIGYVEDKDFITAPGDVSIATDWVSVWPARAMTSVKRTFYFVQDYEPLFYPMGTEALLASQTYELDLDCICASPWLSKKLESKGRWARHIYLAADTTEYRPGDLPPRDEVPRIAFYARSFTPRRAVEIGLLALEILSRRGIDFVVDLFGMETAIGAAPFVYSNRGVLAPGELAEVYREATLGVVFSSTNYSLVPQEMMACGLPVVELDVESTRSVYPEGVVTWARPTPEAVADAIESLLANPERRKSQRSAALDWVAQFSWPRAAETVESEIVGRLSELGFQKQRSIALPSRMRASVVIPTLNGGQLLLDVIERLKQQRFPDAYEIIIVDSGSSDGTVEKIEADPHVRLHRIPPSEFGHGRTRNLGVELSSGEYVAFLTQDALPLSSEWLADYVMLMDHFPRAAGAFGPHKAWPDASPFIARDIDAHFQQFRKGPLNVDRMTDLKRYESGDERWRQFLHFYSDNNSCLRRSVWEQVPYRDVEFGEDQVFADDIIAAGYSKLFVPSAYVYHSHDYDFDEALKRAETEARFFYESFGYVLMPDKAQMQSALAAANAADEHWGLSHRLSHDAIRRRQEQNRARLEGWLAGSSGPRKEVDGR